MKLYIVYCMTYLQEFSSTELFKTPKTKKTASKFPLILVISQCLRNFPTPLSMN